MQYTSREVYEFISIQTNDPIVERKTCAVSWQSFAIYQSDLDFYDKISPTFAGQKFQIPTPTLCPEERQRRRMTFRNERKLYKRTCDLSGKTIISMYHQDAPYTVYGPEARWSDKWSASDYAQDIDYTESFFEQFDRLQKKVPLLAQAVVSPENSDYTNFGYQNKDCYLTYASDLNEKCIHSSYLRESTYCVDCLNVRKSQWCYELIDSVGCYQCLHSQSLDNCSQCHRCYHCINCQNCTGCINQIGKHYMRFDLQLTKVEYERKIKETDLDACEVWFDEGMSSLVRSQSMNYNCELCFWDSIVNAKNCSFCFDVNEIEDCKYVSNVPKDVKSCMDIDGAGMLTLWYDSMSLWWDGSYKSAFCINVRNASSDCYYCELCVWCHFCFGCIGLKNQQYCILNKHYTKEEYELTVAKIITHMRSWATSGWQGGSWVASGWQEGSWVASGWQEGSWVASGWQSERWEFLPPTVSSFGYNETVAQELFPLDKENALSQWYAWVDYEYHINVPEALGKLDATALPDFPDDTLLKEAIVDSKHGNLPRRFVKQEFDFYRHLWLKIPHKHPDIRHAERRAKRSWKTLYLRKCDKCNKEMLSVYDGDYNWKVYCEKCYQKEVYS